MIYGIKVELHLNGSYCVIRSSADDIHVSSPPLNADGMESFKWTDAAKAIDFICERYDASVKREELVRLFDALWVASTAKF